MRILYLALALILPLSVFCQENDQTMPSNEKRFRPNPTVQFAGGTGMISLGLGHSYANNKLESQVLSGYVPKKYAGKTLWILTLKQTYFPFKLNFRRHLKKSCYIYPISIGGSVSIYNLPSKNSTELPFIKNSTMYNYFLGGKVEIEVKEQSSQFVEFYYEIGSNYIETYIYHLNRSTVKFREILNVGIGASFHL